MKKIEKKKIENSLKILKPVEVLGSDDLSMLKGGARGKDCNFSCSDYNPCSPDCFCNNFKLEDLWF